MGLAKYMDAARLSSLLLLNMMMLTSHAAWLLADCLDCLCNDIIDYCSLSSIDVTYRTANICVDMQPSNHIVSLEEACIIWQICIA